VSPASSGQCRRFFEERLAAWQRKATAAAQNELGGLPYNGVSTPLRNDAVPYEAIAAAMQALVVGFVISTRTVGEFVAAARIRSRARHRKTAEEIDPTGCCHLSPLFRAISRVLADIFLL